MFGYTFVHYNFKLSLAYQYAEFPFLLDLRQLCSQS